MWYLWNLTCLLSLGLVSHYCKDLINAADSEQSRSPDKRRLATQHGSCIGRLYNRMNKYLECICVLWPSGGCRGWKGGHGTS